MALWSAINRNESQGTPELGEGLNVLILGLVTRNEFGTRVQTGLAPFRTLGMINTRRASERGNAYR